MLTDKKILSALICFITLELTFGLPYGKNTDTEESLEAQNNLDRLSQRRSETYADTLLQNSIPIIINPSRADTIANLLNEEHSLLRLKRALSNFELNDYADVGADDMELAEINVFRPLFRYRAEYAKQVPKQFG